MKHLLALLLLCLLPLNASGQVFLALADDQQEQTEWPYDPDLPEDVPTGGRPANWNAA